MSRLDDGQLERLEKLAKYGLTQEQIADFFGISRTTLWREMKESDEALKRYKKGRAAAVGKAAEKAYELAVGRGDVELDRTMLMFWLKTQAGWKETQRHEVSGPEGEAIPINEVSVHEDESDES